MISTKIKLRKDGYQDDSRAKTLVVFSTQALPFVNIQLLSMTTAKGILQGSSTNIQWCQWKCMTRRALFTTHISTCIQFTTNPLDASERWTDNLVQTTLQKQVQAETYRLISQTNLSHSSAERRTWLLTGNSWACKYVIGLSDVKVRISY